MHKNNREELSNNKFNDGYISLSLSLSEKPNSWCAFKHHKWRYKIDKFQYYYHYYYSVIDVFIAVVVSIIDSVVVVVVAVVVMVTVVKMNQ